MSEFSFLDGWILASERGSAAELHRRGVPDPAARHVDVLRVARPALVLGSAQPATDADVEACGAAGVEIVRRRTGGGAVLVGPGDPLWVDVVIPAGDLLWEDDVGRAFLWLGDVWAAALRSVGVDGDVHRGPLQRTPWSRAICFAGLGTGEVTVGGRKLVGISQRRTRAGTRFQCAVPLGIPPSHITDLLRLTPTERAAAAAHLDATVTILAVPTDTVLDAFLRHLPS